MFELCLQICVRLATAVVLLGWLLAATHNLRTVPYVACLGVAMVAVLWVSWRLTPQQRIRHFRHRIFFWRKPRRILPLLFFLVFGLTCAGAVFHEPNNFDALSYRIPRVLYWLAEGGWYWIEKTPYPALNHPMPNFEWLSVPFLLLTGDFHASVAVNLLAYLFTPGLFFSLLLQFGVPKRLAYDWMWLFPTGYLFAMQAGGLGNDLLGMTAILAALYFAARFATSGRGSDLFDALLAAGFCTGIKLSNLPLALFVLILLLRKPARLLANRTALLIGTVGGALVSALVPMALNFAYAGSILGTTTASDKVFNAAAGWVGNTLSMLIATVSPPIIPQTQVFSGLLERGLGETIIGWLKVHYGRFTLKLNELPQEESGGLGLGISLALLVCVWLWWRSRHSRATTRTNTQLARWQWVAWCLWLAFAYLVVAGRLGTGNAFPRNLLPWLPLMLAPVLGLMRREQIARHRAWRIVAPLAALSVLPALLLTPARPLIPVETIITLAERGGLPSATLERARVVYDVYSHRADAFKAIRSELPPDIAVLGLLTDGSEPTSSWWKPYRTRRCVYLLNPEMVAQARHAGVQYVAIRDSNCQRYFKMDVKQWMEVYRAEPVDTFEVRIVAATPPERYTLVKLRPSD